VGATGLEPVTFSMSRKRASQLRQAPQFYPQKLVDPPPATTSNQLSYTADPNAASVAESESGGPRGLSPV
jgi:hypothetical protein